MDQMNYSEKPAANSDPNTPARQPSAALTFVLFAALAGWVLSIATGTMLFGEVQDWRKPVFVLIPMTLFLTLWAALLLKKYSVSKREQ